MSGLPICDRARKQAKCIYIAVEATVADDVSDCLTKAADTIEALYEALASIQRDYIHDGAIYERCGATLKRARGEP